MRLLLLLLLASCTFTACKTSFRISVKEPAPIRLAHGIEVFGVMNKVTHENSPEKVIAAISASQSLNGNIVASERAVEGVFRGLEKSGYMRGVSMDTVPLRNGQQVDWSKIDDLCTQNNSHGIIELTEIKTISPVGGTVLANATGQTNTKLQGTVYASVYIANSHELIERISVSRYYNIPLSGNTNIIAILSDVQRKQQYYRALGFDLGYGIGELLYPNWKWVRRQYYTKGSKVLKRAKNLIKDGNWALAEKQLLYDADHRKEKVRGRVLFNLALTKEGQGEIDTAIEFAERSALECGNKLASEYLRTLKRRRTVINQM